MTKRSRFVSTVMGERSWPPPIWLMRQAGRYLPEYRAVRADAGSFLDLCYTPDKAAEVTIQPIDRFDLDAAILFSDILVVPDGLGMDVKFVEGTGPVLGALKGPEDLATLSIDRVTEHLAPVAETVRQVRSRLADDKALIGFAGAPWTVVTYMIEGGSSKAFETTKEWLFKDPESFKRLLDIVTEGTVRYLLQQIEAGANAVKIFDSWAGAVPATAFEMCVIEPAKTIVSRLKAVYPDIPILGFPRGAGPLYVPYATETGVDAVAVDASVPTAWAAEHIQSVKPVQGNMDPIALVASGEGMRREIGAVLDGFGGGPFVFNLGHGIIPKTNPDHVAALVETIRSTPDPKAG